MVQKQHQTSKNKTEFTDYGLRTRHNAETPQTMIHDDRCEDASRVAVGIGRTSDGRHPRPTHRVNQKSQRPVGDVKRRAGTSNDDVRHWETGRQSDCRRGRRKPSPRRGLRRPSRPAARSPSGSPSVARGPLTSFPLAAPSMDSMRGSGATHTGGGGRRSVRKRTVETRLTTHGTT